MLDLQGYGFLINYWELLVYIWIPMEIIPNWIKGNCISYKCWEDTMRKDSPISGLLYFQFTPNLIDYVYSQDNRHTLNDG